MAKYSGWFQQPTDIMEHIAELKAYYYCDEEVREKLLLVAKHIDDPLKLQELEEEWLYGCKSKESIGRKNLAQHLGWDWGWD